MRKVFIPGIIALIPFLAAATEHEHTCSGHGHFVAGEAGTHLTDSALLNYDVSHYGISLEVNDSNTYIQGFTEISATTLDHVSELVFELRSTLQVDSVTLDGGVIPSWSHEGDLLRFSSGTPLNAGAHFRARIYYHGFGGRGGFFSGISNRTDSYWGSSVTYTLSEPFAARDWYACKQVVGDKADSADLWISVGEGLMAGSNGLLQGIDSLENGLVRFHWKTRYPVAYYLLSLSVAEYQDYSFYASPGSISDSILIQNYIYDIPGFLDQVRDDIDETAEMLDLYSRLFSDYPFLEEKYGHCLAPMGGGMEHQTMTTLSSFRYTLVAHELTHQWFGDYVTCASWQDIWVNEGFASYGEFLALEALTTEAEAANWMVNAHEWAMSEPEGSVFIPEEDAEDVMRIFNMALSYKKGASLVHMIRFELENDSLFYNTLSEFMLQYADSVASGYDFLNVLNAVSGRDFGWFFDQWYYGRGFPEFSFTWWQAGDSLLIESVQKGSSSATPLFRTDMEFLLLLENGEDTLIRTTIDHNRMVIGVPLKTAVSDILPDPSNWVLERSFVSRRLLSEGYFSVNPNPFAEDLNIVFRGGVGDREITLCDLSGKVLNRLESNAARVTMNTDELSQGIYLLSVREGKSSYSARVFRQ